MVQLLSGGPSKQLIQVLTKIIRQQKKKNGGAVVNNKKINKMKMNQMKQLVTDFGETHSINGGGGEAVQFPGRTMLTPGNRKNRKGSRKLCKPNSWAGDDLQVILNRNLKIFEQFFSR